MTESGLVGTGPLLASCTRVFANSNGYVAAASTPPATPPAINDTAGGMGFLFWTGLW